MENEKLAGTDVASAPSASTRTVKVIVRHSAKCKAKDKGSDWPTCRCPKSLLIYEGDGSGKNRRVSCKTRLWVDAEKQAEEWRKSWDPNMQELKRLRAEKEAKQVRIVEAVALYTADMITRLGDNGTVAMARSMFGHVNPETKAVTSNGRLFNWLDTIPPKQRPEYVADFTASHITAWRSTWKFGSDLTAANRWMMVKGFFSFCEGQGWLEDSPARKLKPLSVEKGNRTAIFSDEQYSKILDAVSSYDPENVPEETRKAWQRRITTFIELLRWSGMAIVDAVLFRPDSVDADGVLRYRRQKTDELATIPLPDHVAALLKDIPLERDSVGPEMPFRSKTVLVANDDTRKWARRLMEVFKLAGIEKVRTERGKFRPPHPHMLRDTFAVWHLRHGARLHTVAKMLGHAKTATTERAYLPWVKELEDAHIADARRSLKHAAVPRKTRKR